MLRSTRKARKYKQNFDTIGDWVAACCSIIKNKILYANDE